MERRRYLTHVASVGGLTLGSGCLGFSIPGRTTETEDGTQTPYQSCGGGTKGPVDLSAYTTASAAGGFEMRSSAGHVTRGSQVSFDLVDIMSGVNTTGPPTQYAIQRATDSGWEHVFEAPSSSTPASETTEHDSSLGFSWTLEFTEEGIVEDPYVVCDGLPAGIYRFVYYGLQPDGMAAAVEFSVGQFADRVAIEDYQTHVIDQDGEPQVIDGGKAHDFEYDGPYNTVQIVADRAAVDRFNRDLLTDSFPDAMDFVDSTDFTTSYLVVYQEAHSTAPDYHITGVERIGGIVHLKVNNGGDGTDDATLETMFVRLPKNGQPAPGHATVTNELGNPDQIFSTA